MLNRQDMVERLAMRQRRLLASGAAWGVGESTMRAINFTRATTYRNLQARYGLQIDTVDKRRAISVAMNVYFTITDHLLALTALRHYFPKNARVLTLWWCAANDTNITTSTVPNRIAAMITALENSIRGNNRNGDLDQDDGNALCHYPICAEGLKNQLASCMKEAYGAAHPDNVYIPDIPEGIREWLPQYLKKVYDTSPYQYQIKEAMDALGDADEQHPAPINQIEFFKTFIETFRKRALEAFYLKYGIPALPDEQKQIAETLVVVVANLHFTTVPDPVTSMPEVVDTFGTTRREPPNIKSQYRAVKRAR